MLSNEEVAKLAVEQAEAIKAKVLAVNGGVSPEGIAGFFRAAPEVVKQVEQLSDTLKGYDKMKVAVEVMLICVKLPWWLPKSVVRRYLPDLLESALSALKDRLKPKA